MDEAQRRILAEVTRLVTSRQQPVAALTQAAALLQRLPHYTGVYFYELRGETLVLVAHAGRDTEHTHIPVGEGICGLSARTREAVIVEDVKSDPRYLACNLETESEIVVPIMSGATYLAQIDIDSDHKAAFGPGDRAFLEGVAALVRPLFPTA